MEKEYYRVQGLNEQALKVIQNGEHYEVWEEPIYGGEEYLVAAFNTLPKAIEHVNEIVLKSA